MKRTPLFRVASALTVALIAIAIAAVVVDVVALIDGFRNRPLCDVAHASDCSTKVELPTQPFPWRKP